MDVIGFICVSLGSSTVQLHKSIDSDTHVHVQRVVSVDKMADVLEGCTTEKHHSIVRFFVGNRTQYKGYS
jgi:hypothetical protein